MYPTTTFFISNMHYTKIEYISLFPFLQLRPTCAPLRDMFHSKFPLDAMCPTVSKDNLMIIQIKWRKLSITLGVESGSVNKICPSLPISHPRPLYKTWCSRSSMASQSLIYPRTTGSTVTSSASESSSSDPSSGMHFIWVGII